MKRNLTGCGILLMLCSVMLFAQVKRDPRIGTWRISLEKSQLPSNTLPPKMQVRRYEARSDGFTVMSQAGLDGQGNPTFNQVTFKADGLDYANYTVATLTDLSLTGAKPNTIAYKAVDNFIMELTVKDGAGKVTGLQTQVVATDGKTLTVTSTDPLGKVLSVTVFDKQ